MAPSIYPASKPYIDATADFGALPSPTVDQYGPLQAAFTAAQAIGGAELVMRPGTYRSSLALTTGAGVNFHGANWGATTILFDDTAGAGITSTLTATTAVLLTANLNVGDRTATLIGGGGASVPVGSTVILTDTATNTPAGTGGGLYHGMWISRVLSVAGDVITLEDASPVLLTTAQAAQATVFANGLLQGVRVADITLAVAGNAPGANRDQLINLAYCEMPIVERVRARYAKTSIMQFVYCLNGVFSHVVADSVGPLGDGIAVINSVGTEIDGAFTRNCPFGIGGYSAPLTTISRSRVAGRNASSGRGIKVQSGSYRSHITDCHISDSGLYAIGIFDSPGCKVEGGSIYSTGTANNLYGVFIGGYTTVCDSARVIAIDIRDCVAEAIAFVPNVTGDGTPMYATVSGCTMQNVGGGTGGTTGAIRIMGSNITITACVMRDYQDFGNAISMYAASGGVIVEDCIFRNNGGSAVNSASGSGANVVRNNTTVPNPNRPSYTLHATDTFNPDVQIFPLTYGATVNTNAAQGELFTLAVTNTTAFTMANPTNLTAGREIEYEFLNSSGGVMGVVTWGALFKLAGALTNPANTFRRKIKFRYNGANLIENYRSIADI